jgi:hypothetical protein
MVGSLAKFLFGEGQFSRLHSAADAIPYLCLAAWPLPPAARSCRRMPQPGAWPPHWPTCWAMAVQSGAAGRTDLRDGPRCRPALPASAARATTTEGVLVAPGGFGASCRVLAFPP